MEFLSVEFDYEKMIVSFDSIVIFLYTFIIRREEFKVNYFCGNNVVIASVNYYYYYCYYGWFYNGGWWSSVGGTHENDAPG